MQSKDLKDASKGLSLSVTGAGSIFETFFKRSDVCSKPIPDVLHMTNYMIAFMWQSCNDERAASHINIVKIKNEPTLGRDF